MIISKFWDLNLLSLILQIKYYLDVSCIELPILESLLRWGSLTTGHLVITSNTVSAFHPASVFTVHVVSLDLLEPNEAGWRLVGLWGLLLSDSAVQWAGNPGPDLACLCFCGLPPSAPAVEGEAVCCAPLSPPPLDPLISSNWVCATEGSSPRNGSIVRFYETILKRVSVMGSFFFSFCVLFIFCRVKKVKMKSDKNLIDLIIFHL